MHRVSGRQLSGKGGDIVVAEVTSKYLIPHRFGKLGNHGDCSGQVFRFGGSNVKLRQVPLVLKVIDVWDDIGVEHVADIIRWKGNPNLPIFS